MKTKTNKNFSMEDHIKACRYWHDHQRIDENRQWESEQAVNESCEQWWEE